MKDKPHYTVAAAVLADWVESQPSTWWSVDGDPVLTSVVDFPCPGDELAAALRRVGQPLLLRDKNAASGARGETVGGADLDGLAELGNRKHRKIYRLSWAGSDIEWLLLEDEAMVGT